MCVLFDDMWLVSGMCPMACVSIGCVYLYYACGIYMSMVHVICMFEMCGALCFYDVNICDMFMWVSVVCMFEICVWCVFVVCL